MKVLLVEDEPDLGLIIQKNLIQNQYIVDWAIDGEIAWNYLTYPENIYTLAIIDWMLPKISGIELCQRLRAANKSLPILILTARDRMEDKIIGLDSGADDYLVKPFGMAELLARLRALQRRSIAILPNHLAVGNLLLNYGDNAIVIIDRHGNNQSVVLTAKEFQLLEYFMKHPNQILTQEQIRMAAWNFENESFSNIVAAQIRLLRKKLAEVDSENMIETIRGFGYRLNINHAE